MKTQLLVVLLSALASSEAGCPGKGYLDSLDLSKFKGVWYQYASYGTLFIHGLDRCVKSTYELDKDDKTIHIVNDRIAKGLNNHVKSKWTAVASDASKANGKLELGLKLPLLGKITVPLMVLDTDYDNYAVLYVCKSLLFTKFNFGFILTRQRKNTDEQLKPILKSVDAALEKVGVKRSKFGVTNQDSCEDATGSIDATKVGESVEKLATNTLSKLTS